MPPLAVEMVEFHCGGARKTGAYKYGNELAECNRNHHHNNRVNWELSDKKLRLLFMHTSNVQTWLRAMLPRTIRCSCSTA